MLSWICLISYCILSLKFLSKAPRGSSIKTTDGSKTKVSLRPERAIIDPEEKMDNKHKGKIEEVIYHGDHARVRLNLLGNKEFILKVPNSSARMDIKLGNEINVGWNSHDARALDPKSIWDWFNQKIVILNKN